MSDSTVYASCSRDSVWKAVVLTGKAVDGIPLVNVVNVDLASWRVGIFTVKEDDAQEDPNDHWTHGAYASFDRSIYFVQGLILEDLIPYDEARYWSHP